MAYAPPCASTSALKSSVTPKATAVNTSVSGRVARTHSGAMPYGGRYRGTSVRSPAMADAPANQRMAIVLKS